MKTRIVTMAGALPLLAALAGAHPASASSHREAPNIADDPAADNTDLYAWVTPGTHDKLNIVANWIPLEEPSGGPNFHRFSDEVRYEIHLVRGADNVAFRSYYITFDTSSLAYVDPMDLNAPPGGGKEFFAQLTGQVQTYKVERVERNGQSLVVAQGIKVAPLNIGPRTQAVAGLLNLPPFIPPAGGAVPANYDDAYAASFIHTMSPSEGRVWAGPRDDGFYVDLGGVFDLANLRPKGTAQDGVAGYNTHSIVLEIPTTSLTMDGQAPGNTPGNNTLIGVYASTSRKKFTVHRTTGRKDYTGTWTQVSRLGLPLVNEALIGLQDKDRWNAVKPFREVPLFGAYFLNPVVVRDAEAVGIYMALGVDPTPFKSNRLDIIDIINLKNIPTANAHNIELAKTGDILRVDMATDSGFPNGRPLVGGARPDQEQADVTDVLLSVILAGGQLPISDGVDYNDKPFLAQMPWLPLPWRGYDQGHGKPTP